MHYERPPLSPTSLIAQYKPMIWNETLRQVEKELARRNKKHGVKMGSR
jgi:hypothetical protein